MKNFGGDHYRFGLKMCDQNWYTDCQEVKHLGMILVHVVNPTLNLPFGYVFF